MDSTLLDYPRQTAIPARVNHRLDPGTGWTDFSSASLRSLVHHAAFVEHDAPLEHVHRLFSEKQVEFVALVRDGMVTGLCSRLRLGILLGARYGFALYSRSPAHLAQVERPLVFPIDTPVRDVLDQALARPGDEFHEDVALVDASHALIGLVPIDALARLQTRLASGQLAELQRQHEELRTTHDALRKSQGRYTGLFESHTLGVALLDDAGTVAAHNRRLAELLNLDFESAALASLIAWVIEPDRTRFAAVLQAQASGNGAPTTHELTFAVPERGHRLFRCSLGWIAETKQICACFDDITDQRAMERLMSRQEKQTLLDTLVGGIAHELNNKLTPVQGFSELIALSEDPQTRHYAEMIGKCVGEAAHIIRQLLQLSKPNNADTQLIDLRVIVAEALSMLRFQIRESRAAVQTSQPVVPVWVRADAAQIKQVVMNLALNGLQAMSERAHAVLKVAIDEEWGCARVVVADNGVGIPPENLERIFDPFFTTKGPERGTGLGLSVCYSIVQQHGGEITVESEPDAGAKFVVQLPAEAAGPVVREPVATRLVTAVAPTAKPRTARVLVVEDEVHVRRLIQEVLWTRFGCEVDTATHGVDAFERLAVEQYALVISDIRMPTMNGTELYLWLREAQPLLARRFIFVTGYPGDNHLEQDLANWNVPVLSKPFTVSRLCELCAPYLEAAMAAPVPEAESA